ncbi:MAG TPA: PQQ-dependent sugar dehydrogenase [Cytophagaceae bacterium]
MLRTDLSLEPLITVRSGAVRIAYNEADHALYYVTTEGNVYKIITRNNLNKDSLAFSRRSHGLANVAGLSFFNGAIYLLGNKAYSNGRTGAIIKKGWKKGKITQWKIIAHTEPIPPSNTTFDHRYSSVAISPDGKWLFFNSGSRTDHGEEQTDNGKYPGLREIPLTSAVFRVPLDSLNTYLPNDSSKLAEDGYLYADGLRNSYELAFDGEGNLFGCENSGDRDDPEELNWIREGRHYGFPWKMSLSMNKQLYKDFDPAKDLLINQEYYAWNKSHFRNDPAFPPPPDSLTFSDPIFNFGPDADKYRDSVTGKIRDASDDGASLSTFSGHRSPLGLVFDKDSLLKAPYRGSGFLLSWTPRDESKNVGALGEKGEDLVQLIFRYDAVIDNYKIMTHKLVDGLKSPIDAEIVGKDIFILENGKGGNIWRVSFPVN